ncbi:hypothetical protein FB451DRAFT_1237091 [Mycena latifolia]|nr:hypothetical protein FB451DRAFT_1237091 [Mycena latifolia]
MSLEAELAEIGLRGPVPALRLKIWCTAQLLAPFLFSPERSPLCASALVKVTQKLLPQDADLKTCIRILRTEHHASLDGLVHFVAVPRTEDELRRLEARLSECRCDLSDEVLQLVHDTDDYPPDLELSFSGMIESIFAILVGVVENGLKVGHVVGAQAPTLDDNSTTTKWPSNTAALFPAGPEAAVISFARLFRLTRSPIILHFMRISLPHCPSLAMPISESTSFWEAMVEGLRFAVDKLHEDPLFSRAHHVPNSAETNDSRSQHIVKSFTMFLSSFIATFTESLRHKITSSSALAASGRKIYDLLLKVLLLAKPSPNQDALTTLCFLVAGMALCISNALPSRQRPTRIHPVVRAYGSLQREGDNWAFTEVFGAMSRIASSSVQKLRYCARCRLMRYCSGACQKAAWKYHKAVCADLETLNKKVMPKFPIGLRAPDVSASPGQCLVDFEKEAKKHGFTEERMKEMSAELMPFCHFQNAGMTAAPSHEEAYHF